MASSGRKSTSRIPSGPIAFFLSIILVVIGLIQLVSTFHTYATNLAELNALKKTQAALVEKNQELQNDIARWSDDAYVAAQARERLGFVFPGEQAIRVLHPEAVGGDASSDSSNTSDGTTADTLPWYKELSYAFEEADKQDDANADGNANADSPGSGGTPSSTSTSETTKDNNQ
ncbi:FtsB family cell division protein [Bifidobacterium avesanii]|uniref:Septum formation initiator family protein n=1 Tax=Bifidobacterium avesanii TaxID=1798157 RepID=A0A7K3THG6_9BIFI|nr:septum formation initiator family protein [Bifidobacterium avesanii]KAB8292758.1 septum formation initiator family protein [Bifidobacterium avesanii]NEG78366.1 septum formation initiator family protein [Bifidobacterium avesanii]